jgi:RimJ/RimL family protein N-acetyltransferase
MFTGKLVRLREYRKDDIPLAQKLLNDPEMKLCLPPGIPFLYTLEDEEKWFASNTSLKDTYNFSIETLEGAEYLGGCGLNSVDWKNSKVEVGIFIGNKDYLGRGYGTDAMKVLIAFIFNEMNIRKINLNVYSFNERAIKSYKKCGFVVEGVMRQEIFKNGAYHDELKMGLLRDEWKRTEK